VSKLRVEHDAAGNTSTSSARAYPSPIVMQPSICCRAPPDDEHPCLRATHANEPARTGAPVDRTSGHRGHVSAGIGAATCPRRHPDCSERPWCPPNCSPAAPQAPAPCVRPPGSRSRNFHRIDAALGRPMMSDWTRGQKRVGVAAGARHGPMANGWRPACWRFHPPRTHGPVVRNVVEVRRAALACAITM